MTCRQMGGMCDAPVQGATPEELMGNGMAHLEEVHPDMAKAVKEMPKDDPKMVEWSEKFMTDFQNAPEN